MSKRKSGARARTNKGPWKHQVQAERRKFAEERQAERDKLTPAQQIERLDRLGHRAVSERARLAKLVK